MKEENSYLTSFNDNDNPLDYKKFGLFNEYGLNLDRTNKSYKEEDIIKKKCNLKNKRR